MNTWVAIVLIVAIVMAADAVKGFAKAKSQKRASEEEVEEMMSRIGVLEERIRVLERIVTEDRRDLRAEISQL